LDNSPLSTLDEKVQKARAVLQEWVGKQGHERCWYYPDLFGQLAEILEVPLPPDPSLSPLEEFRRGCERYQREEYKGKTE
jgi:hypothetical protein